MLSFGSTPARRPLMPHTAVANLSGHHTELVGLSSRLSRSFAATPRAFGHPMQRTRA